MSRRTLRLAAGLFSVALLAACGSDGSDDKTGTSNAAGADAGSCETLPLKKDGQLTVATGEPAYEPWVVDDDPSNKKGFEASVVYAVADELGIKKVEWTRTGFDEAVAPGDKDFDFNVQQYSITPDRDEVVDFSRGYYTVQQAVIASEDSPIADAKSLADLKDANLGAAIGTTSLDYAEETIAPSKEVQVFDDNAAAKAAFDAGHVDGIVFDLPTAYYITSVEIPEASIVGLLPVVGDAEELGFLFQDGSPLVPCVNKALDALDADGTLAELQSKWLAQGGDIPTLTE